MPKKEEKTEQENSEINCSHEKGFEKIKEAGGLQQTTFFNEGVFKAYNNG